MKAWVSEFIEIIDLAVTLFESKYESGSRIAVVLLDNCVEFMYKAYLRIEKRVVGTGKKYPINPNDWESIISRRFDKLAEAMVNYSNLPSDLIDKSLQYHIIRNDLYHTDTPLKTSDKVFKEQLAVVLDILNLLFKYKHVVSIPLESSTEPAVKSTKTSTSEVGITSLDDDFYRRVDEIKEKLKVYWRRSGGKWTIVRDVYSPYKIMMALLLTYPKCKSQTQIASDTELSRGLISNIISGKNGKFSHYFEKCEKGYRLSDDGVYFFIDVEDIDSVIFSRY